MSAIENSAIDTRVQDRKQKHPALLLTLRLTLLVIAITLTTSIALGSKYGAHPDERFNINAAVMSVRTTNPPLYLLAAANPTHTPARI